MAVAPRLGVGTTDREVLTLKVLLTLGLPESVELGVPPVPHALVLTLQDREAAGEEETLGEGVALTDWLRDCTPVADVEGEPEVLPLARTESVGSGEREGEAVTV